MEALRCLRFLRQKTVHDFTEKKEEEECEGFFQMFCCRSITPPEPALALLCIVYPTKLTLQCNYVVKA